MHQALAQAGARVDAIFFCPHSVDDNCRCRKPKTGMLEDIAHRLNTSLAGVPIVGDSLRDVQAATAVGGAPMLVLTGNGKKTRRAGQLPPHTRVFADLSAAVDALAA
jgi:D-glycero-D-manno-heptose 1,7-bisphosphate phosphatase